MGCARPPLDSTHVVSNLHNARHDPDGSNSVLLLLSKYYSRGKQKAEGGTAGDAEEDKGTGKRNLYLQFTCNRCNGVSQYMINRSAYEEGIVICTCQTCKVKHLLADNLKKVSFAG